MKVKDFLEHQLNIKIPNLYKAEYWIRTKEPQDSIVIWNTFLTIINKCGITVTGTLHHFYNNHALTGIVSIMESHASIHTWPEKQIAYVEFVTFGHQKQVNKFTEQIKRQWEIIQ